MAVRMESEVESWRVVMGRGDVTPPKLRELMADMGGKSVAGASATSVDTSGCDLDGLAGWSRADAVDAALRAAVRVLNGLELEEGLKLEDMLRPCAAVEDAGGGMAEDDGTDEETGAEPAESAVVEVRLPFFFRSSSACFRWCSS